MTLTRLSLSDFRCYPDAVIVPGPGINILTGNNGAGKTNILEAISLLAPGRGLRGAALGEMARQHGRGGFGVAAQLGECALGTGTRAAAPERRIVRINGVTHSATALSEWLSLVWLTPAMDRLFSDSASGRRRFLDRLVLAFAPDHARHSSRYEAAMRQRNRLLGDETSPDPDWLSALEEQMAVHGSAIAATRAQLLIKLSEQIAAAPAGAFAKATLAVEGWRDDGDLAAQLAAARARDAAAGRTLLGPHRCDLRVVHQGKAQPAENCSTGEQKALLISIILAHADLVAEQRGQRPILLLDEVAAHLDTVRRGELFERLQEAGGQVWMTGTDRSFFAGLDAAVTRFSVSDAKIAVD